jgi:Fe-Mn family superoxide dismutase
MGNLEGKHQVNAMPFGYEKVVGVMDEETYKWHHDTHYAGYVNKRNEVEVELAKADRSKANANYSAFRELKLEETWNANGAALHELYWGTMGGDGKYDQDAEVIKKIVEDFGSVQAWKDDMMATAKSGRGWAVLGVDALSDGKLRNLMFEVHNQGGIVGSAPLIVVDVFEHAYYHKFGPDRGSYLNALIDNIDWEKVGQRFARFKTV